MKFLQRAAFLILTLYAFSLSSQAQAPMTYKAESGVQGNNLEAITIIITKVKTGYAVSGEFISSSGRCQIQGSYFPTGRRLRATCIYDEDKSPLDDVTVTGFKLTEKDKDAFQITMGNAMESTMVAYRNGIKPKDDTTGGGKPKSGACTLAGTWNQVTKGIGSTSWSIAADGTAKETGIGNAEGTATLNGNVLHIEWHTGTGYTGYYEWPLDSDCSSDNGTLKFKTPRTDSLKSTVTKTN